MSYVSASMNPFISNNNVPTPEKKISSLSQEVKMLESEVEFLVSELEKSKAREIEMQNQIEVLKASLSRLGDPDGLLLQSENGKPYFKVVS